MITQQDLTDLCKEYFDEHKAAASGWSTYSKVLRKQIPGKTQLRTAFIENLGEMMILCDDKALEDKITKVLKKYA